MSSLKHDMRCSVGILMMNAKRSSMNVFRALYLSRVQESAVAKGSGEGRRAVHTLVRGERVERADETPAATE